MGGGHVRGAHWVYSPSALPPKSGSQASWFQGKMSFLGIWNSRAVFPPGRGCEVLGEVCTPMQLFVSQVVPLYPGLCLRTSESRLKGWVGTPFTPRPVHRGGLCLVSAFPRNAEVSQTYPHPPASLALPFPPASNQIQAPGLTLKDQLEHQASYVGL